MCSAPILKLRQWFFFPLPCLVIEEPGIICRIDLQVKCPSAGTRPGRGVARCSELCQTSGPGELAALWPALCWEQKSSILACWASSCLSHSTQSQNCPWKGYGQSCNAKACPWYFISEWQYCRAVKLQIPSLQILILLFLGRVWFRTSYLSIMNQSFLICTRWTIVAAALERCCKYSKR